MNSSSDALEPVELLADEFMERQRRGERPSIDEYVRRHPELAYEIREVFPALAVIEQIAPASADLEQSQTSVVSPARIRVSQIGDYRILREIGRGGMGVVYEAEQQSLRRRVALKVLPRQVTADRKALKRFQQEARAAARMHHTNIVPVFEVGQDDEHVYYAMQLIQGQGLDLVIEDLQRLRSEHSGVPASKSAAAVALADRSEGQSIAASLVMGEFEKQDLIAEARQAEGRSHRSAGDRGSDEHGATVIADTALFGGGSTASAVLPGKSEISTAETDRGGYFRSVARIGQQTASALSYAHARGIIHRDIKPSNLLLDTAGVVWVTDFGLAKTGDEALTHTGDILGTIRYMSPERFRGQCDVRADVYSLGLTLYELLVLKPAFASPDRLKLIELVTKTEPPTPRNVDPRIPRDLETIVLKSIDKDPRRRYQSADELCEDLERFIQDEPIKARRISLGERLVRWSRRNRGLAASLAVVCGLLLVINIAGPLLYWRMVDLKQEADRGWKEAEQKQRDAEQKNQLLIASEGHLSDAVSKLQTNERVLNQTIAERTRSEQLTRAALDEVALRAAHQALTTPGQYFRGKELLDELRPRAGEEDRRGIEFHLLNSLPDTSGGRILYRNLYRYRMKSGFSPDGKQVAVVDDSGTILILDARTGTVVKRLAGHTDRVWTVLWFAGGTRLVSSEWDGPIRVWDAESGLEQMSMPGGKAIALSPDETRLVTGTNEGMLQIRDISTGELLETFPVAEGRFIYDVDWSSRNRIAFCATGGVYLRDLETGESRPLIEPSNRSNSQEFWLALSFSPDGSRLVAGNWSAGDHPVLIWDLEGAGEPTPLRVPAGVIGIDWNHAGTLLATASWQSRAVEIWDPSTGERVRRFTGHSSGVGSCAWSPDDRQVVSYGMDGTARVWNVQQQKPKPEFAGHRGAVYELAWSPNSRCFATAGNDLTVRIWDAGTRKELYTFTEHASQVRGVDWNPQDNRLVSCDSTGRILVWTWDGKNAVDIREVSDFAASDFWLNDVIWSPDGTEIAVAAQPRNSSDGFVRTYADEAGKWVQRQELSKSQANSVSWQRDPAGNSLLAGAGDEVVKVWNSQTREELRSYSSSGEQYYSVALSPLGDRVAFGGQSSGVAFDVATSTEPVLGILNIEAGDVLRLRGHEGSPNSICWSRDSTRLLTAADDGTAILWDAATGRQLLAFEAPERLALYVAQFSPDELQIAMAGMAEGVQLLDATPSYAEELSEKLLPGLERRIADQPTAEDLVLRGRIQARQGSWDDARNDFDRAARLSADAGSPPSWFETCWWVAGPNPEPLADRQPLEEQPFDAHQPISAGIEGGEERSWSAAQVATALDLGRLLAHKEHISAWALLRVYSTKEQTVGLLLGADDQVRVWLNGDAKYTRAQDRAAIRDDEVIEIILQPGWNDLLFQVTNHTGPHGLFARLSDDPRELAEAFDRNDQFEQALKWADRARAGSPDDAPLLYVRGRAALRTGRRLVAEESFDHVVEIVSNKESAQRRIAALYLEHGRSLRDVGRVEQATASLDRARALYERLLQSESPNERDAAGLADVLLYNDPAADVPVPIASTILKREQITVQSAGGATLTELDDDSILASGVLPAQEVYTVIASPVQKEITCIVLETLPDPTLPFRRSGRHPRTGNFLISDVTLAIRGDVTTPEARAVQIASDFVGRPDAPSSWIQNILDHQRANHWTAWPDVEVPHGVVLELAEPLRIPENGELQITINCSDPKYPQNALGRFRLSVSDSATAFEQEQARLEAVRQRAGVLAIANGWDRLAVAYQLLSNVSERDALLARRPEAAVEVARYLARIGRHAEAIDVMTSVDVPADKLAFLQKRGEFCLQLHDQELDADDAFLKRAADDYSAIAQLNPAESLHWLKAAALLAAVGDIDGYRQLCEDALDRLIASRFSESESIGIVERIVKICLIFRLDDSIRTQATQILDEAIRTDSSDFAWAKMTALLSDYRAERYDEAIERGNECLKIATENESGLKAYRNMRAFAYLVQAMSYYQLGDQQKEAETALEEARTTVNDGLPEYPEIGWWDSFISRALLDEADKLIHAK